VKREILTQFQKLLKALIALLFLFSSINFSPIFAQEAKDYHLTDKAYGLAYDGVSFWFVDSNRRALIKINEIGQQEVFNLGIPNLRGISYDDRESKLLVVGQKVVFKIDPNSGGITERLSIPIENMGGIASVGNFYYILDLDLGKVMMYDRSNALLVGGFLTDRNRPRDLCFGRDSIWISDSADNTIYRYDAKSGKITGSIKSNTKSLRGLLLSGQKLWVVDREAKEIKNIPFVETERFIASGEEEFTLEVTLKFHIDTVSLSKAQIAILHPPSNEQQRIRSVKFFDPTFTPSFLQKNRAHIKKMSIEDSIGEQVLRYRFTSRNQYLKYYVGDDYLDKGTAFSADIAPFRDATKENPKFFPRDYLQSLEEIRKQTPSANEFRERLIELGFAVQPFRMIRFEKGRAKAILDSLSFFLPSFGWLPVVDIALPPNADKRYFEKKDGDLILYQSLNSVPSVSPVYFRKDPTSPWENLPAEINYKIK
jgi:hypothetical protein